MNLHVVRATAQALIASNPSLLQHFARFEMPKSWVQSIYRPYRALTSRSNKDTVYETLFVFFRVLSAFFNEKIVKSFCWMAKPGKTNG